MSRRRVTEDELELWRQVAKTTKKLHPTPRKVTKPQSAPRKPASKGAQAAPEPLGAFRVGQSAGQDPRPHDLSPTLSDRLAVQTVQMDSKAFTRLKRGKLKPEARIDLHGMTLEQAHPALMGFILRAQRQGRRLVLVITGKGRDRDEGGPIPVRAGVLRHAVPGWLAAPPLGQVVLQVAPAHLRHGGGGAFYVYLRRPK